MSEMEVKRDFETFCLVTANMGMSANIGMLANMGISANMGMSANIRMSASIGMPTNKFGWDWQKGRCFCDDGGQYQDDSHATDSDCCQSGGQSCNYQ